MDILKQLEKEHNKKSTEKIVSFIDEDLAKFNLLLDIFLHGEKRLSQRAAWPLSYVGIEHPHLILDHMPQLLRKLGEPDIHDAVKRNILRAFQEMEIPEKYEAIVVDTCFRFI